MAISVKLVNDKYLKSRPTACLKVATDWVTGGYLKWCLMYSRNLIKKYFLTQEFIPIFSLPLPFVKGKYSNSCYKFWVIEINKAII